MTDFDPKWKHGHVTRCGFPAHILDADFQGDGGETIIAKVKHRKDAWTSSEWYPDGRYHRNEDHDWDLLNAPSPAVKMYANVYRVHRGNFYMGKPFKTLGAAGLSIVQEKITPQDEFIKTIEFEVEDDRI